MAINNKFVLFKNKYKFDEYLTSGELSNNSICFIEDSKEIGTQGSVYKTVNWNVLDYLYVDLGLPSRTLWSTFNVGAAFPEDYGDYFAWGETSTKSSYGFDNCIMGGKTISELKSNRIVDDNNILNTQFDAASINWDNTWRIPTKDEFEELIDKCTWEWISINGVNGYKVSGNGNYIFLPASGRYDNSTIKYKESYGCYNTSTNSNADDGSSYFLNFTYNNGTVLQISDLNRYYGRTIRPVLNKTT